MGLNSGFKGLIYTQTRNAALQWNRVLRRLKA